MFRAALAGGAQAAGAGPAGLAVGQTADILALATPDDAGAAPVGDVALDQWIFAAKRPAVDAVWRRGEQVVSEGHHVARAEIARRYARALARVLGGE